MATVNSFGAGATPLVSAAPNILSLAIYNAIRTSSDIVEFVLNAYSKTYEYNVKKCYTFSLENLPSTIVHNPYTFTGTRYYKGLPSFPIRLSSSNIQDSDPDKAELINTAMQYLGMDFYAISDSVISAPESSQIADAFVSFYSPIKTSVDVFIKHNFIVICAHTLNIPIADLKLEEVQGVFYGYVRGIYFANSAAQERVIGTGETYSFGDYRPRTTSFIGINPNDGGLGNRCKLSRVPLVIGSVGKVSQTYVEGNFNMYYRQDPRIEKSQVITYTYQVTSSECLVLDVHDLVVSVIGNIRGDIADLRVWESWSTATDLFSFPVMPEAVDKLSALEASELYTLSLVLVIYSEAVTKIPGWQVFLSVVVPIVLVVLSVIAPIAFAIANIVSLVVDKLVSIIADAVGGTAGIVIRAIGNLVTAVISGNYTTLLSTILSLLNSVLNFVTEIISGIAELLLEDLLEESQKSKELYEEENDSLKGRADALGLGGANPLMIGAMVWDPYESPTEYYNNRLRTNFATDTYDLTHKFVKVALTLHEDDYEFQKAYI